jgi:hypothetical protein
MSWAEKGFWNIEEESYPTEAIIAMMMMIADILLLRTSFEFVLWSTRPRDIGSLDGLHDFHATGHSWGVRVRTLVSPFVA